MSMPPRRIRNLPPALPPKDTDVFPISQMDDDGVARTRAMSRAQNNADMIEVVNESRQDIVDMANAEHAAIRADLSGKADKVHTHKQSEITGLPEALAAASASTAWDDVTGKPSNFPPSTHTHSIANVTGLQAALDAKVPGATLVGTVTLAESALITLALAVRKVTVACLGTVTTGNYLAIPASATPAGYSIQEAVCATAGQITVSILVPVLSIAGSYSIPVRVWRLNG